MSALPPLFRRLVIRFALRRAAAFVVMALLPYLAVEGVTEYARRRFLADVGGSWTGEVGAIAMTSVWAFLAHQRFTFRGVAPRPNPFAGAVFLFVLTLAVLDAVALLSALEPSITPFAWLVLEGAKYVAMRALIWPGADERAAFLTID